MTRKVPAVALAAMLVVTAFASVPVAAAEAASVVTEAPSDVTTNAATLNGNLTGLENASEATVWFEYWPEGDAANATTTATMTVAGTGPFTIDVLGLQPNTTYVVVANAETANASATGSGLSFTTDAGEAVGVSTGGASDLTDASATLTGELTQLHGADNATVWFEYWTKGDDANATATANRTLGSTGAFSAGVTGLANNTTYVFVAHAATDNTSAAGEPVQFTTLDRFAPLAVDTGTASDVGDTSATLNGQLTGLDGAAEAAVWFEYWVQGDRANRSATANQTLTAPGSFSAGVSGLDNETTYVYVARVATNGSNVTGDEVTFTTSAGTNETVNRTWDGEGAFGRWLSEVIRNLVPPDGVPFGQVVSEIVTANNPGSEHRSDRGNPGGNSSGPPEHAGPPDDEGEDDHERGPPDHAKDDRDDEGDDHERGPPDHANNDKDKGDSHPGQADGDEEDDDDDDDEDDESA